MNVIYKCACMEAEVPVFVRDRGEGEDVVHWVEQVIGAALATDHRARSPFCRATAVEYVKIPVDLGEDARIGRITRQ